MRRVRLVVPVVALVVALVVAGCGSGGFSRDEVRSLWVSTYVREFAITQSQAECIVDRFFAELSDAELRPLTKGAELSDAQAARVGELAVECGVGPTPTTPPTTSADRHAAWRGSARQHLLDVDTQGPQPPART